MRVEFVERKSRVLARASLACLSNVASINLTAGCALGCIYCYIRGYANHPPEGVIHVYANTADKLRGELNCRRQRPTRVFFSPASDLFQPIPEVLDAALEVLRILFEHEVGVSFLTKGQIPRAHMDLMKANGRLVQAQIGIITLDEDLDAIFEPNAAPPPVRLEQARELIAAGVRVMGRMDPILPELTDNEDSLRRVCTALQQAGVKELAAGTLFLRPTIVASLKRNLRDRALRDRLLAAFVPATRLPIRAATSTITPLPIETRRAIFKRLAAVAADCRLELRLCACKNPDLARGSCHIAGRPISTTCRVAAEPTLFDVLPQCG